MLRSTKHVLFTADGTMYQQEQRRWEMMPSAPKTVIADLTALAQRRGVPAPQGMLLDAAEVDLVITTRRLCVESLQASHLVLEISKDMLLAAQRGEHAPGAVAALDQAETVQRETLTRAQESGLRLRSLLEQPIQMPLVAHWAKVVAASVAGG